MLLTNRFECKPSKDLLGPCSTCMPGIRASIPACIRRIPLLPKGCTDEQFASTRAKIMCIANSRPDVAALVSILGSITVPLNKRLQRLHATAHTALTFPKLDLETLLVSTSRVHVHITHESCVMWMVVSRIARTNRVK